MEEYQNAFYKKQIEGKNYCFTKLNILKVHFVMHDFLKQLKKSQKHVMTIVRDELGLEKVIDEVI